MSYGITREDVERLRELPYVRGIVQMREVGDKITRISRQAVGSVVGTTVNFFKVVHVELARGRSLSDFDNSAGKKVCVIGDELREALFSFEDPLGNTITVQNPATGPVPYEVVGVLKNVMAAGTPAKGIGSRDVNRDVYIPLRTVDLRYGDLKVSLRSGSRDAKRVQISDFYLNAVDQERVLSLAKLVARTMAHGHRETDYKVIVPLELLQKAAQTKRTWQIVLGSIAGISLLVGGIGIMNIMLASVTERTREIGIRRALGAPKAHITAQFLVEALLLSISGGIIGIIAGILFAMLVTWFADFETIIPWWSVVLSFLVSAGIGITFGLYPARAAAALDPIEALRYE